MLAQNDVLAILMKDLNMEQVHVFNCLHAYAYSKASRGNLPSEVLGKVLSIQRKLLLKKGSTAMNPPRQRAFDAMKSLLLQANRRWLELGPRAWGPLGQIGVASNVDARWCWTKATNGQIKDFPDVGADGGRGIMNSAAPVLDAGRVIDPRFGYADAASEGLPQYMPPTPPAVANGAGGTPNGPIGDGDTNAVDEARHAEIERREAEQAAAAAAEQEGSSGGNAERILTHHPDGTAKTKEEMDLERGKQALARLREERMRKEQEEEEARKAREQRAAVAPLESPA